MSDRRYFTHLHLHTDYSLLDGAITIDKLIEFGKKHNRPALGISDHGNVFGAVKFFQKCKKAGIKPILGMEAYFAEDIRVKNSKNRYYHLTLIVQNTQGYKNLCKLISHSYQDGFYFKPRIDYALLEKYSAGLIATSGCFGGHIPKLIVEHKDDQAIERIDWFVHTFGKENFYLELHPLAPHEPDQKRLNDRLFELSAQKNIPLLAAGDCHYATKEDKEAHEILLSIQTHDTIDNPERFSFGECEVYMRTEEEMLALFPDHQDAVWASGKIADRCTFELEFGKLFFPQSPVPAGVSEQDFFEQQSRRGLAELFATGRIDPTCEQQYMQRLHEEMALITKMGFVGYLLVVSDFVQWALANGIPVGPGRGSAAGSLVAWALRITNIDPIRYNLLFERFLNPERVSMPDIDIDFCIEGRERVINYVRDKYGHANVCQIITFGTMLAKAVIKDVARALNIPFDEAQAISDLVPEQLKITLKEAIEQEPELKKVQDNPKIAKLFDIAQRLEGLTRHASKHAAGIVISPEPVDQVLPVYIPPKSTDLVAQYAMSELESLGFLKMDFLGLKNLTLIKQTVDLIEKNHRTRVNIDLLPLDDPKAFQLLSHGMTSGVFQLESSGIKDVLRRLQPDQFEDIIAVNALYRPGPLGSGHMVDDFIERRHGRAQVSYLFHELEPVLKETYGVIVYQEQVMKIASAIAGYSLGEADILRRAMGKKKAEVMAEQKTIFTSRSVARGFDQKKSEDLFELMAYFAGYGFNKSHSAAYSLITYQTAYLKAHYPAEFMACLISLESSDPEKQSFYIQEAKDLGLLILPPHINTSENCFSVEQGAIRFGLIGIKNVGQIAIDQIKQERTKRPFEDLLDFCYRVDLRTCNKRVIENLVYAGALDSLPGNRAQKIAAVPHAMDQAAEYKERQSTGQLDLFAPAVQPSGDTTALPGYQFAPKDDFPLQEKLLKEKEVIGLYVSSHPTDVYKKELSWLAPQPFASLIELQGPQNVLCAGCLTNYKVIVTKKGDKMAFISCEDQTTKAELIAFPKVFAAAQTYLDTHSFFVIAGSAEPGKGPCKIKVDRLIPLDLLFEQSFLIKQLTISFPCTTTVSRENLLHLKELLSPGDTSVQIDFFDNSRPFSLKAKGCYTVDKNLLLTIEERFTAHIRLKLDL